MPDWRVAMTCLVLALHVAPSFAECAQWPDGGSISGPLQRNQLARFCVNSATETRLLVLRETGEGGADVRVALGSAEPRQTTSPHGCPFFLHVVPAGQDARVSVGLGSLQPVLGGYQATLLTPTDPAWDAMRRLRVLTTESAWQQAGAADLLGAADALQRDGHGSWADWFRYCASVQERFAGQPASALPILQQLLESARQTPDSLLAVRAQRDLGLALLALGRREEARAAFDEQRALARSGGWQRLALEATNNIALTEHYQGNLEQALELYRQALEQAERIDSKVDIATENNNIGGIHFVRGEGAKALARFDQAISNVPVEVDPHHAADFLGNRALMLVRMGRFQEARDEYLRILKIYRGENLPRAQDVARTLSRLGRVAWELDDIAAARSYLDEALQLQAANHLERELGQTLVLLGEIESAQGNTQLARTHFDRALQSGDPPAPDLLADAWLGRVHLAFEEPGRVIDLPELIRQAEAAAAQSEDRFRINQAAVARARWLAEQNRTAAIAAMTGLADDLARMRQPLAEARLRADLARLLLGERRHGDALNEVQRARSIIAGLRAQALSLRTQAALATLQARWDDLEIRALFGGSTPAAGDELVKRSLALVERSRFAALESRWRAGMLAAAHRDDLQRDYRDPGGQPDAQSQRDQRMAALLAEASAISAALVEQPDSQDLMRRLRDTQLALDSLEVVTARSAPQGYPVNVERLERIAASLPKDWMILRYAMGEGRLWRWTIRRDAPMALDALEWGDAHADQLEYTVRELRRYTPRPDPQLYRQLGAFAERLLPPVDEGQPKRIIVVPDGRLAHLPFAALRVNEGGDWLIERQEVAYLPGIRFLGIGARESNHAVPERVLLVGDPVFANNDGDSNALPRLANSRVEVERIAALAAPRPVTTLLGHDASRTGFLDRAAGYHIIHLATHGLSNARLPQHSGVMLSELDHAQAPVQGFVNMFDIRNLTLSARLIVLNGCETSIARTGRVDGIPGLLGAFLSAGGQAVISTDWQVSDRAAAQITVRVFEGLWHQQLDQGASLRAAQRAMIGSRRYADPFFWAGYRLTGGIGPDQGQEHGPDPLQSE